MKMYFLITVALATLLGTLTGCGGNKEKAQKDSAMKAEKEKQQKEEQDKKQAWEDLLKAFKDEQPDAGITSPSLCMDFTSKDPLRHFIKQGKLSEKTERFVTMGKKKVETGYVFCISESSNPRVIDGKTVYYDWDKWFFSTDEKGNILDVILAEKHRETTDEPKESIICSNVSSPKQKDFTFDVRKGKEEKERFSGERIKYKLENGKFVEKGRKKESYNIGD